MTTTKNAIGAYIFFGGSAEEAANFYVESLEAEIKQISRFSDSPDAHPEGAIQPGFEDKVMHCHLEINGSPLYISDGGKPEDGIKSGFMLTLTLPNAEIVDQRFNALAKGGQVLMPPGETFFSPRFAMVTDKYGLGWMLMVEEGQ